MTMKFRISTVSYSHDSKDNGKLTQATLFQISALVLVTQMQDHRKASRVIHELICEAPQVMLSPLTLTVSDYLGGPWKVYMKLSRALESSWSRILTTQFSHACGL